MSDTIRLAAAVLGAALVVPAPPAAAGQDSLSARASVAPDAGTVQRRGEELVQAGRFREAEDLYRDWFARNPKSTPACEMLAGFLFQRTGPGTRSFDSAMSVLETCVTLGHANEADAHQTMAMLYWDKAYRDATLTDRQKDSYADLGLRHASRALEIKPNLFDALVYKGLLLRTKASVARDTARQAAYLDEAVALQKKALDLRRSGAGERSRVTLPVPPPLPPPPPPRPAAKATEGGVEGGVQGGVVGGVVGGLPAPPPVPQAVRVGGAIKEPHKLKNVPPIYPDIAKQARVQGVVIMECTISPEGKVVDVKILRGIPLLDAAAVEAVQQWEYTPTLLNGVPVPVIMTVTVNFRLS